MLRLPSAPVNPTPTPGSGMIELAWDPPTSEGGYPITNYSLYRGTISGGEGLLIEIGSDLTYTDAGLTNGLSYFYQVSASNALGEGPRSAEVSAIPQTTPGAPEGLSATPADRRIDLQWQAPSSDGGSPITGYAIYRGTSSGGEILLTTLGNVLTYSDTGLTNGLSYFYQVTASNALGEGPRSIEVSFAPGAPSAPRDLQATPSAARVDLVWQLPVSQGNAPITNYRIYRGTASGAETFLAEVGNILTYSDAQVSNDTTYFRSE